MRSRVRSLATGLACLLGTITCGDRSQTFWRIPNVEGARSYLLAFEDETGWRAVAGEPAAPVRILHPPGATGLYFLAFNQTLTELGLESGEVALASLSAREDCLLVLPRLVFSRRSDAAAETGWTPDEVPDALYPTLAPDSRCARCASFEVSREILPDRVLSAAWLDSGAALLVLGDHSLARSVPGELAPLAACGYRPFLIRSFPENEVWVATSTGIGRTRIDESTLRCADAGWFPQPPDRGTVVAFGAASAEEPVWVLTSLGSLERLEGGELIEKATVDMGRAQPDGGYQVVLHENQVLVSIGSLWIHRFEQGRLFSEMIAPAAPTTSQITALASVPPRALFGTNSGHLYARDAAPWTLTFQTPEGADINSIAAFRGGALLVTELGVTELPERGAPCVPIDIVGSRGKEEAMIARDELVLLPRFYGSDPVTHERPIVWLHRR
ncbi:MAG: hypothetical protein IT384_02720 [Deltaproteobacteria bacterium]|nr:hypothetical protein [Deltaproteobacteria bacterium]